MASTATRSMPGAPWRAAFLSHVDAMDAPLFVLSTLHALESVSGHHQQSTAEPSAAAFSPRARTVVYRGMWAGLKPNPNNTAPRNPANAYQTDLLTIGTDARMEKVSEMLPRGHGDGGASCIGPAPQSRLGGPVEGVFWASKAKTQWRIRGRTCILGPDIESDAARPVRRLLASHMRSSSSGTAEADATDAAAWGWAREVTAHFGNLNPVMRGSFRNPPPGTPISQAPPPDSGLGLGQQVDHLDDEIARGNFRVLVIIPEQVDQVDLSDPERGRRWRHDLVDHRDKSPVWTTTELWP